MPSLTFINNGTQQAQLSDPDNGVETYKIGPGETLTVDDISIEFLTAAADQIDYYRIQEDENGDPIYEINISFDADDAGVADFALADTTLWIANHVAVDLAVSAPSTPSVVSARRVDHNAGEVYAGGVHFTVSSASDETGDAEILEDGTNVAAVDLVAGEDVYAHLLLVNNGGALRKVFVRGTSAATGTARELTREELATAVGNYLGLSTPSYAFVEAAKILYEESGGLSETVTDYRWVPGSYD